MKVLFIYPENESLGIQILSSVLKQRGHHTDLLLDPKLYNDLEFNVKYMARKYDSIARVIEKVRNYEPDLIAFSVVTDEYLWSKRVAKNIKKQFNDVPIVFGGIHPTAVPEKVLENSFVDFVIVGEGEDALLEFVENFNFRQYLDSDFYY